MGELVLLWQVKKAAQTPARRSDSDEAKEPSNKRRSIEYKNRRLNFDLDSSWALYCSVVDYIDLPYICDRSRYADWIPQVWNRDGRQVQEIPWYRCSIAACGSLRDGATKEVVVIIRIDVINQARISCSVRVDVPTSIVKWVGDLSRQSFRQYWHSVFISYRCFAMQKETKCSWRPTWMQSFQQRDDASNVRGSH